jgi:hypothetical protein
MFIKLGLIVVQNKRLTGNWHSPALARSAIASAMEFLSGEKHFRALGEFIRL